MPSIGLSPVSLAVLFHLLGCLAVLGLLGRFAVLGLFGCFAVVSRLGRFAVSSLLGRLGVVSLLVGLWKPYWLCRPCLVPVQLPALSLRPVICRACRICSASNTNLVEG